MTPPPRLVPDRPSDAAIAQAFYAYTNGWRATDSLDHRLEIIQKAREIDAEYGVQPTLTEQLQMKCSVWGTYWRAPDAHGVILNREQALELLRDALGVEVEIDAAALPAEAPALFSERHGVDLRSIKVGEVLTQAQWDAVCAFVREQEAIIDSAKEEAEAPAERGESPSLNENSATAWAVDWELRALDVPLSVGRTERTPDVHPSLPAHYQTRLQFGEAENPGNTVAFVFGNSSTENESRAMAEKLVAAYNAITPRHAATGGEG